MKSKTETIVGNLESLSNQTEAFNKSSSSAVDFLVQSISEAESETRRANNLTNAVERVSNESQSAGVMVENQAQLIVELSTMIQQFNGNLTSTNELIGQGELEENTTHGEIESLKVFVILIYNSSLLHKGFNTAKIKARETSARFLTQYGVELGGGGLYKLYLKNTIPKTTFDTIHLV